MEWGRSPERLPGFGNHEGPFAPVMVARVFILMGGPFFPGAMPGRVIAFSRQTGVVILFVLGCAGLGMMPGILVEGHFSLAGLAGLGGLMPGHS